jgi:hypothetical protein
MTFVSNVITVHLESHRICYQSRRIIPEPANNIPASWIKIIKFMAVVGAIVNGIVVFIAESPFTNLQLLDTLEAENGLDPEGRKVIDGMLLFLLVEICLVVVVFVVQSLPKVPVEIKLKQDREVFLVSKLVEGVPDIKIGVARKNKSRAPMSIGLTLDGLDAAHRRQRRTSLSLLGNGNRTLHSSDGQTDDTSALHPDGQTDDTSALHSADRQHVSVPVRSTTDQKCDLHDGHTGGRFDTSGQLEFDTVEELEASSGSEPCEDSFTARSSNEILSDMLCSDSDCLEGTFDGGSSDIGILNCTEDLVFRGLV